MATQDLARHHCGKDKIAPLRSQWQWVNPTMGLRLNVRRRALIGYVRVGDDLPDMTIFALEVEPPTLVKVVDLPIRA